MPMVEAASLMHLSTRLCLPGQFSRDRTPRTEIPWPVVGAYLGSYWPVACGIASESITWSSRVVIASQVSWGRKGWFLRSDHTCSFYLLVTLFSISAFVISFQTSTVSPRSLKFCERLKILASMENSLPNAIDLGHHVNAHSKARHPSPLKDILRFMAYDGMVSLAGGL